jgi:hypothetical protein
MTRLIMLISFAIGLSACATVTGITDRIGLGRGGVAATAAPADPFVQGAPQGGETTLPPATTAARPPAGARTAEALDTTTPEQRAAAAAPASDGGRVLGRTIVSLGAATEPGLWLKTPLVQGEAQGRVTNSATGQSSRVTLIPIDGPASGGSRMSLSAMRLIGASLTDLTEVEVSLEG